ncbi:MAG: hypothetical protein ACXVEM_04270 [Gaiellaceae bacterium]
MKRKVLVLAPAVVAIAVLAGAMRASADLGGTVLGGLATIDPMTLFAPDDPTVSDPANNDPVTDHPPHFPKGGKFKLFGTAAERRDPNNAYNEVVSFDTNDPNAVSGAFKKFGDHVKIGTLTDMLDVKYFYVGRTCGGGSTRVQLGLDLNGDGKQDINAFGYLGDKPFGGGCPMNQWVYEDMTDGAAKWDTSQLGVTDTCRSFTETWSAMVSCITTEYPNHRVLNYVLVDDSQSFFAADRGCAYFDLFSAGARTFSNWDDASDGSKDNTCP